MAPPMAISSTLVLFLLVAFAGTAGAACFTITNRCPFPVWPAAIPYGGGKQLSPGEMWNFYMPAGTTSARIWPRTCCYFGPDGRGGCQTVDCAGALHCGLSGKPPATLAEFALGGDTDNYDISVIDGFNLPMEFSCSTGPVLRCGDANCADANRPGNGGKGVTCKGGSNYQVVFCP